MSSECEILDYRKLMFDDTRHFFSNSFWKHKKIKQIVVRRYSSGVPDWQNKYDAGTITESDASDHVCFKYTEKKRRVSLEVSLNDTLTVFSDKKKDKCSKLLLNMINADLEKGLSTEKQTLDVCVSENLVLLINDLKKLSDYERIKRNIHPVRFMKFSERSTYIVALAAFAFMTQGMNADQLIHISEIALDFELSSDKLLEVFRYIQAADKSSLQKALDIAAGETENKKYLAIDMLYLVKCGKYTAENENIMLKYIHDTVYSD